MVIEGFTDVGRGTLNVPPIDFHQVSQGPISSSLFHREPHVLHGVAIWAQSDESRERLNVTLVVIHPDLMTLHRVPGAFPPTDLTAIKRQGILLLAELVPVFLGQPTAKVVPPGGRGHQFNGKTTG